MSSKAEQILHKLASLISLYCLAKVERNSVLPEKIPPQGLIIIRDGDPGDADIVLGGFDPVYYSHNIPIELYIECANTSQRDQNFDDLILAIGNVLTSFPTLEDLAFGMTYNRPELVTEPILGGPAIKTGTIELTVEYEASHPLA